MVPVARAAGFPPSAFNAMLTGRKIIRAEYIDSICKALRVTPNELYMPREQYKGA
ncbi:MAG: helix-turn-helix domain-containing protein [Ruthenibacterium lactatiformans]